MAVTYISSDTLTGIRTPLCRTSLATLLRLADARYAKGTIGDT